MKNTLTARSSIKTRYETIEFRLAQRVKKTVSIANGAIELMKGTNVLSITENTKVDEAELKIFVKDNFINEDTAFNRIKAILFPASCSYQF